MADHEAVEEAREAYKSKKACLLSDTPADGRRKGQGAAQHEVLCAPVPFSCNRKLRSYYTKTCPKITYSLVQLHGVEFSASRSRKRLPKLLSS